MGNYYGMATKPNFRVFKIAMIAEDGGCYVGLYHVTTRKEAFARAYREFPNCKPRYDWCRDEDQMSRDELNQCREELGLSFVAPVQKRIDLSVLDMY